MYFDQNVIDEIGDGLSASRKGSWWVGIVCITALLIGFAAMIYLTPTHTPRDLLQETCDELWTHPRTTFLF